MPHMYDKIREVAKALLFPPPEEQNEQEKALVLRCFEEGALPDCIDDVMPPILRGDSGRLATDYTFNRSKPALPSHRELMAIHES